MKDFIKDGDKIRKCDSNFAKMNMFEYMRYFYKWHEYFFIFNFKEVLHAVLIFLSLLLFIILIPIVPFIRMAMAYKKIKRAKKFK